MALSQLRPTVIEGDRPASKSDFVRLPGGGLILTGQKPVQAKPGMLAGLRDYFAAKLKPQTAQDQFWIPKTVSSFPSSQQTIPSNPLPQYNEWAEIENEVLKEQRIKDAMGALPQNVMSNKFLIEGKF